MDSRLILVVAAMMVAVPAHAEEILPPGVYADLGSTDPDSSDGQREIAMSCATRPIIGYPDGRVVVKELDSYAASAGGEPYAVTRDLQCAWDGATFACEGEAADGGGGYVPVEFSTPLTVIAPGRFGPEGTYLVACNLGDLDQDGGDGRNVLAHIIARSDGGPLPPLGEIRLDPPARPAADAADFVAEPAANSADFVADANPSANAPASLPSTRFPVPAGIYTRIGDQRPTGAALDAAIGNACFWTPMVIYSDGLMVEKFSAGGNAPSCPSVRQQCGVAGDRLACASEGAQRTYDVEFMVGGHLRLCEPGGGCDVLVRCSRADYASAPTVGSMTLFETIVQRPDGGPTPANP